MIISRREQKNDLTRKQILSAAETLFTEKGYDDTSIEDISNQANIAKGTLYYHFASKEAIVIALRMDSFIDTLQNALKAINKGVKPLDVLEKVLLERAAWTEKNPELTKVFFEQRIHQFLFREGDTAILTKSQKVANSSFNSSISRSVVEAEPVERLTGRFFQLVKELIIAAQENKELRQDIDPAELTQIVLAIFIHAQGSWIGGYSSTSLVDKVHRWLHAILDGLYA